MREGQRRLNPASFISDMRYGQMRQYDIANGSGIRSTIFVTGCRRACPECFNEEYQNFQAGSLWTEKETQQMIQWLRDPNVEGLTLLGGEPMENAEGLAGVVRAVKAEISKSVWVYSGYLWEEILRDPLKKNLLELCDVLVDGPFINALRDPKLQFRGSSNQRVIDIAKSLKDGRIVLYRDEITGHVM